MRAIRRKVAGLALALAAIAGVGFIGIQPAGATTTWYDLGWHNSQDGSIHISVGDSCGTPGYNVFNCRIVNIDSNDWVIGGGVVWGATQFGIPEWAWPEEIIDGNPYASPRIAARLSIATWAPYDDGLEYGFAWNYTDPCGNPPYCGSYTAGTRFMQFTGDTLGGNSVHHTSYAWNFNRQMYVRGRIQWVAATFL